MVKAKYQSVLDLGEKLKIQKGDVKEENGRLTIKGVAATPYEKNLLWDEIKKVGGENPNDLVADIDVANTAIYAKHKVESGESLSKISKHYYGDMNKYNAIYEANRDKLDNPDMIKVGQELVIPNI